MSFGRNHLACKLTVYDDGRSYFNSISRTYDYGWPKIPNFNDPRLRSYNNIPYDFTVEPRYNYSNNNNNNLVNSNAIAASSLKRHRVSSSSWEACGSSHTAYSAYDFAAPSLPNLSVSRVDTVRANANTCATTSGKHEEDVVFLSRDEIEGHSPSRKDGIDTLQKKQL